MMRYLGIVLIGTGAAWSATSPATAQSVADFYKGKTIEFITTSGTATSDDNWARLLARYLPKYIPGQPTMIVKNMPGGGHIRGANYLFNVAPQDGTTIGMTSRNIPTGYVLGNESIKFDVTKFSWLGSTDQPNRVCVVVPTAKVQTGDQLYTTPLLVPGTGAGSAISTTPNVLKGVLGMKFEIIEGYKSSTEAVLALERGEVEGICQTTAGIENQRAGWIKEGKLKILFSLGKKPLTEFKAPTIYDFVKNDEQRQIVAFYNSNSELGRPVLTPPNVPKDRVAALQSALEKALADPELIKDADRQKLEYSPLTGAELTERIEELVATPKDIIAKTNAVLGTVEPGAN